LGGNSQGIHLFPALQLDVEINHAVSTDRPLGDPVDELCGALFARITKAVVNHETDDWPSDYDRLYALICRVIAQSSLSADAKPVLTRCLIERVAELEKKWPRLKPNEFATLAETSAR
jgi:hypothetical protein